ncbi:hypothetical protein [Halomonas sp. N3-2A]|uniref:hypothetical protein n=1 Tax=Halomonas sp. N3-2A TaxID=2014541 RepID=UPI000B5B20BD|nr:hypothetical protein [Halomonas sp. N3-2A]ASK18887.1 hypothetical protein CEK60_06035 [Halomonas sp. N3-2A]
MSEELKELYLAAQQNQEAIQQKESEITKLRKQQRDLEQALMNKVAATAGDDSQPFTNAALFVFSGVFAVSNSKLF